jgi:DNA polymerase-4
MISYTSCDHLLLEKAKELFWKLYDRRLLVRLMGIRFTHLVPGNYQIHMFDDTQEMIRLYQAIDSIKNSFGAERVMRARSVACQNP